jgi:hypothetical protein
MNNFTTFKLFFTKLNQTFEERGMKDVDIHKAYYQKVGVTDPEKIKLLEVKKTKEMQDRIKLGLELIEEYGSVYEIEDFVKQYVMMNRPPPRDIVKKLQLPFKSIFIETSITNEDADIGVEKIGGIMIIETTFASTVEQQLSSSEVSYKDYGRCFLMYYCCEDKGKFWIDEFKISLGEMGDIKIVYSDMKTFRFLKTFIMNFLLFKNDPEVEEIVHVRDTKNRERRIKDGKMPLPSSRKIKIIGRLKVYIDGIRDGLPKGKWTHSTWVAGFYRTLRSSKFTHKKGQIIHVSPHKRGSGVLLRRGYELKFENDDDRKVDLCQN